MRPILEAVRVAAGLYLIAMMFSMGLELGGRRLDKQAKRHERRLLVRGLALNLILLPLYAVTLTRALGSSGDIAIALLLLAASPGGRFAPHLSRIAGGELGLSVELTIWLVKMVAFTAPVTARWMLHLHHVELSELKFILQLLGLQLLPYLAGRALRRRRARLAEELDRPMRVVLWSAAAATLVLVLLAHPLRGVLELSSDRGWWAVVLFATGGTLLGWLVGAPHGETRRTLALSAGARNLPLALMVGSQAFGERNVLVAAFAVWLVLLLIDLAFAVTSSRGRAGRVPPPLHRPRRDESSVAPLPHSS
jgi:BASS family bile acid:Na+ symporter